LSTALKTSWALEERGREGGREGGKEGRRKVGREGCEESRVGAWREPRYLEGEFDPKK
jgi:hypothetical protein